jgi:Phosphate-selective porin
MAANKSSLVRMGITLPLLLLMAQPLRAQTSGGNSESDRLQKLERAVEQLQKRNAELEKEVSSLKKQSTQSSTAGVPGKRKTVVTYDGKSYVEKSVTVEEKPGIFVTPRGTEFKLVLGGFIQMNLEDGAVSAFEGRFGETALQDRFRLRRARINLTGDFAENFDFKVEGDFEQSDGTSNNRTDFSGTDIFVNWHQFPEAQIKVGQWKAPFGLEQLTPDTTLLLAERSLPTGAITPDRQVGAQLWGKPFTHIWPAQKDLLTYYAGIFNGNGRNVTLTTTIISCMWVGWS